MLARAHETERDVMFFFIFFFGGQPSVEQAKFASAIAVASGPSNLVLSGPVLTSFLPHCLFQR